MPEGDTIFVAARNLRKVLESQVVTSAAAFLSAGHRGSDRSKLSEISGLAGQEVVSVKSRGKHLMISFRDSMVLHSHMGMTGAWHIYRPDDPWLKPARFAAVQILTSRWCVVCFSPRLIEFVSSRDLDRDSYLSRLGPDLLQDSISTAQYLQRMRTQNQASIGEAIMNQTVVSGVGNVYKSEVLFVEHIHPQTTVRRISDSRLLAVRDSSIRLMKRNVRNAPRQTRFSADSQRLWVYGRRHQPCFYCGDRIEMIRQGSLARSTYFCATCQPAEERLGRT